MKTLRCLFLEDDPVERGRYSDWIRDDWAFFNPDVPIEIDVVAGLEDALQRLGSESYDLFVADVYLDGLREHGLRAIEAARQRHPRMAIVGLSSNATMRDRCVSAGADDFASKVFMTERPEVHDLGRKIGLALTKRREATIGAPGTRSGSMQAAPGRKIFIGHGRSPLWRDLKDFVQDRLGLPWDEFNRVPTPGLPIVTRLEDMLGDAGFAFLILTGEDEQADGKQHARLNVVHEAGLFQGKLGFRRAILLVEEGCEEFGNISGLTQVRFKKGNLKETFEDVRRVLEREGLLQR